MKKKDIEIFRQILEAELAQLLEKAENTVLELVRSDPDAEADPLDRATSELSRNNAYRIRSRESRLINKIKNSLNAIDAGTYGICEDCEEPISIERLKVRPVARHCIACKNSREAYEKVIGY